MAMNLLFLALIALVPFSTNLMSDYSEAPRRRPSSRPRSGWLAHALDDGAYTRRRGFVQRRGAALAQPFAAARARVVFFASIPVAYMTSTTLSMVLCGAFVRYPLRLVAGRVDETSS